MGNLLDDPHADACWDAAHSKAVRAEWRAKGVHIAHHEHGERTVERRGQRALVALLAVLPAVAWLGRVRNQQLVLVLVLGKGKGKGWGKG